jgi:membrane glycosyltransferase
MSLKRVGEIMFVVVVFLVGMQVGWSDARKDDAKEWGDAVTEGITWAYNNCHTPERK